MPVLYLLLWAVEGHVPDMPDASIPGERFDGHDYIDMALDRGAAGCFCARLPRKVRDDKAYIMEGIQQLVVAVEDRQTAGPQILKNLRLGPQNVLPAAKMGGGGSGSPCWEI